MGIEFRTSLKPVAIKIVLSFNSSNLQFHALKYIWKASIWEICILQFVFFS